ncbi:MAG TPA: ABC transporter ATP-binding protein [Thermoanaerobaculia bacterium]|nr:ABC transporter ATP-binding protein [Thermoanaerobaculia bacterium]
MIEIENLTKSYPSPAGPVAALRDVDLRIAPGQLVAVVGKSGSGKTTLLNMIGAIDRPTAGEVTVAGTALAALGEKALARWRGRTVGVVFQFFQLLPTLTAAENVMLPMDFARTTPSRERRGRALALLDRVGVGGHADKLPAALSGGEQQRVAIARAMANDPPIVLGDEPTGNLDSGTSREVFGIFRAMADAGRTVVIATHERDLASVADRVVEVADGALGGRETRA